MSSPSTVLITGGNRGIGKGLVKIFLARPSFTVIVGVRDPSHPTSKALHNLPVGEGTKLITVKLDSSVPSDAAAAVTTLKSEHGISALDIVIANAGIASEGGPVRDTTVDNIKKHFDINTIGPIVLFQAVADLLQASKTGKPLFVAISTLLGSIGSMDHLVGLPSTSPYGGSKAALNWFIRRLHFEEPWLTSFVIHPGLVETDLAATTFGNGSTENLSAYGSITIETSVTSLVNVIDKASKELSGTFQNYDGTPIAW
ncbi:hypothetical protein FANTH_1168 [Fusarium anthophilum]|uniref:Ketoreductase n=1 Tax=Fusarium anthophilum TaxID=48485 RepID=A0A8H5EBQ3_9HYPO|nr:hypothetical protein FANTH_1168 [Fusarium anthophilum]